MVVTRIVVTGMHIAYGHRRRAAVIAGHPAELYDSKRYAGSQLLHVYSSMLLLWQLYILIRST